MIWGEGKFGELMVPIGSQFLSIFASLDALLFMWAITHLSMVLGLNLFSLSLLTCTAAHSSTLKNNPKGFC